MRVSDFNYSLPPELIAQSPLDQRDGARMLTVDRVTGACQDRTFRDLPTLLQPGDLLVLNDSRVIPARLFGRRVGVRTQTNSPAPTGIVEVLLTRSLGGATWTALVKPGRKVPVGERLLFGEGNLQLVAEVIDAGDFGERTLRFGPLPDFYAALDRLGHIPLPPYIHRAAQSDEAEDRERYQTVYAGEPGSAAAPTAGLHFTPAILAAIRERGVEIAHVTLHVGLGTFQPVHVENVSDIVLHEEHYTVSAATADALGRARSEGRRIVAAGTTTVRTLEHCAAQAGSQPIAPHSGSTSIFLKPGHHFSVVDALLTNFHLPQSTLLMLVSAFAGREHVLRAYAHAVEQRYRFFSYGDCMFLS